MVSYKPLWITLLQRDITKTELRTKVGFSTATLARMSKNEYVALECIDRICQTLGCGIADVIEILPDTEVTPGRKIYSNFNRCKRYKIGSYVYDIT